MEKALLAKKLSIIKHEIEAKSSAGKLEQWRYSEYKALSDDISAVSGIRISHTTLIRIFKKEELQSTPQLSTLKALALYLGYTSWDDFVKETDHSPTPQIGKAQSIPQEKKNILLPFLVALPVITLFILAFYFVDKPQKEEAVYLELATENVITPQILSFKYKVPSDGYFISITPKSFLPYLDLKPKKGQPLPKTDTVYNQKISTPENYVAIITKENEVVLQKEFQFKSKGWLGIIQSKERKVKNQGRFKDIVFEPSYAENTLAVPEQFIKHMEENMMNRYFETNYFFSDDFDIDANHMVFETRFQNIFNQNFIDGQINKLSILTHYGMIEIPITNNSYRQHAKIWFSDYSESYENSLLPQYVHSDISNRWMTLRIEVSDFEGKVYIDGQLIDTIHYEVPLGALTGFRYKFTDIGEVDYACIKSFEGDTLFYESFNSAHLQAKTDVSLNR